MEDINRRVSSLFITLPSLLLTILLLIAALVYKQRDLSILTLLVVAVAGAAKLWTTLGHRGTLCRTTTDRYKVFPGNSIDFGLTLKNNTFLPLWFQITIPLNGLRRDETGVETCLEGESSLLWHDSGRFRWELTAPRRGVYRPGPVGLTSGDLFGFFPKTQEIENHNEIVVYPRLVPLKPFSIIRRDFFGTPGDESPVRDPVYILGTHDYQFGRPARFIHWKASARRHVLQEKVFEPTEQEKVLLIFAVEEFARSGESEGFERSLEAVASLAALFDREGVATGFITDAALTGKETFFRAVRRDPGHLPSILEILARIRMEKGRDLTEELRGMSGLPYGITCLCFSHRMNEGTRAVEEYFKRRRIPVIHYVDIPSPDGVNVPRSVLRTSIRAIDDILVDNHEGVGRA